MKVSIKEAKEQIKNTVIAYRTKDELGNYLIPIEKQRPIFLIGKPGIGKTAIMEQIASEMGVALLSYSMTHHTRQSALGLPLIVHKNYEGTEYDVSEYTMSEIIAAIYDKMKTTGIKEGILFLDEINCVSETLSPIMLQFLQYKVFGGHRIPDGWIVVTAGNPPEYNNSVREFDIVTLDRLKRIDVKDDFAAWKEYAYAKNVHPAILTYLELKNNNFYKVENTVDGKQFVTARGWDDLSEMIKLYEKNNIPVDKLLISQYVQDNQICRDFAGYYDLFNTYRSDYQVEDILAGKASNEVKNRAKNARFDERISLLGLIVSAVTDELSEIIVKRNVLEGLLGSIKKFQLDVKKSNAAAPFDVLNAHIKTKMSEIEKGKHASNLSREDQRIMAKLIAVLEEILPETKKTENAADASKLMVDKHTVLNTELKKLADKSKKRLDNVFSFLEEVFSDGQEILIFETELSANPYIVNFIRNYGCEKYHEHSQNLHLSERRINIADKLKNLKLD